MKVAQQFIAGSVVKGIGASRQGRKRMVATTFEVSLAGANDTRSSLMVAPKLFSNLGPKPNLKLWSVSDTRL